MIRKFTNEDLDDLMKIWLSSNIEAHDFIDASYWKSNYKYVESCLRKSDIYIYESEEKPVAFVAMLGSKIEGIFVDKSYRDNRIGSQLLDEIKQKHKCISLTVYEKNTQAINFYRKNNFELVANRIDEATGELELEMEWEDIF